MSLKTFVPAAAGACARRVSIAGHIKKKKKRERSLKVHQSSAFIPGHLTASSSSPLLLISSL